MATVDDGTLDAWAQQVSVASTWVAGSQGRKLQALSEQITAAKTGGTTPPADTPTSASGGLGRGLGTLPTPSDTPPAG